ncbi:ERF family protein [Lactobacillus jensenii]|uniref:Uncharacterized protein n=1 Tax=Lactobacillus jensenii TaxID=109790 RepID=A0A5N1IIE7_LACJE|nr:ERF family protein [Lactobacillus jensenii]KAA9324454.1 hypothetical protein F6H94_00370 [Lactobacillus jensenii]
MIIKTVEGLEANEKAKLVADIFKKFIEVKKVLKTPKHNSKVEFSSRSGYKRSYGYSTLDEVLNQIDIAIKQTGGLSYTFENVNLDSMVGVRVFIFGDTGAWIEFEPFYLPGGRTAQDYGSALTYLRRYCISSVFGIASEEDDDAQSISQKPFRANERQQQRQAPRQQATAPQQQPTEDKSKKSISDDALNMATVTYQNRPELLVILMKQAVDGDKEAQKFIKELEGKDKLLAHEINKRKLYEKVS